VFSGDGSRELFRLVVRPEGRLGRQIEQFAEWFLRAPRNFDFEAAAGQVAEAGLEILVAPNVRVESGAPLNGASALERRGRGRATR